MATRLLLFVSAIASAACSEGVRPDFVAKVGDVALTAADLDIEATRVGDRGKALESLVDAALLAEAAKTQGLFEDPTVRAKVDRATREALGAALLDRVVTEATAEPALRARYETEKERLQRRRVHVAHIVVHDGADAQTKISMVQARLRSGAAFDAVARELSEDEPSAARGGELSPIIEGQIDGAFFAAAAKLGAGETSEVVKTEFGMHVIHALAEPVSFTPSFDEARGKLAADAMANARTTLLEGLRKDASVTRP